MADERVVHAGENSPEYIAFRLTQMVIVNCEKMNLGDIDRQYLLDTYAECLHAVSGRRDFANRQNVGRRRAEAQGS